MGGRVLTDKEAVLDFIKKFENPLNFHEDPTYGKDEVTRIKEIEDLVGDFYVDLRTDGFIRFQPPSEDEQLEDKRIVRFTKIAIDISNKLVQKKDFNPKEQWFILLSIYCWWCEMIKNLLLEIAKNIYRQTKERDYNRFMTMVPFLQIMNSYKNGKYERLFLEVNVDLRNSFVHGKVDFPNDDIKYFDRQENEKSIEPKDLLFNFMILPPLYASLFSYKRKIFIDLIKEFAKGKGWI